MTDEKRRDELGNLLADVAHWVYVLRAETLCPEVAVQFLLAAKEWLLRPITHSSMLLVASALYGAHTELDGFANLSAPERSRYVAQMLERATRICESLPRAPAVSA